jgi:hypothetical protein
MRNPALHHRHTSPLIDVDRAERPEPGLAVEVPLGMPTRWSAGVTSQSPDPYRLGWLLTVR